MIIRIRKSLHCHGLKLAILSNRVGFLADSFRKALETGIRTTVRYLPVRRENRETRLGYWWKTSSLTLTTPNLLTLTRILTVPVLVALLLFPQPAPSAAAAAVFFAASITDFLDGYIARNYGSGSTIGKFLDPLADKLVVTAALIMLSGMARTPRIPAWIVVVLVSREILVTGLRAVAAAEGRIIAAEELGKYKMVLQVMAVQGLLIHYTYFNIDFFAAGLFILWIALVVSIWSGVQYFVDGFRLLAARERTQSLKRAAM
jgi:CDP-diacylglycerol--glycerol-3-phosphate 3-phosphatidyltransferase